MKLKFTGLLALASAVLFVSGCGLQPVQEFTPTPTPAPAEAAAAPVIAQKEDAKAETKADGTKAETAGETKKEEPKKETPKPTEAPKPTATPIPTPAPKLIGTKTEEAVSIPIENATDKEFVEFYITWEGADDWGAELLGEEKFAAGEKAELCYAPSAEPGSYYNLQMVCADQSVYYVTRLPLEDMSSLQIFMKDEDTWAKYTTISDKKEVDTYELHHQEPAEEEAQETAAADAGVYYDPNYVDPGYYYDPNAFADPGYYYDPNYVDPNAGGYYDPNYVDPNAGGYYDPNYVDPNAGGYYDPNYVDPNAGTYYDPNSYVDPNAGVYYDPYGAQPLV